VKVLRCIVAACAVGLCHSGLAVAAPCDSLTPFGTPVLEDTADTVVFCESKGRTPFFVADYDRAEVAPQWVAYSLSHAQMVKVATSPIDRDVDGIDFQPEEDIENAAFTSPKHDDYTGIGRRGFDRGHYLPAEAMTWSLDAFHATFNVANIAIQASSFNKGVWARLEAQERGWACDHRKIFSVTGVIFGGPHAASFKKSRNSRLKIFIPTHFWKVVFTEDDGGKAIGVIFKNSVNPGKLENAIRSVREIEHLVGIDFMPEMAGARQDEVEEAEPDTSFWKLDYSPRFKCRN
jgi:endonuclease G, mitochondrial